MAHDIFTATLQINTDEIVSRIEFAKAAGSQFEKLINEMCSESSLHKLIPSVEPGPRLDELGETLASNIFRAFEAACLAEISKGVKVGVTADKPIGQKVGDLKAVA